MQNPRRRNRDRLLFLPLFPLSSLSITGLVVLLAVGPQSVLGRNVTTHLNYGTTRTGAGDFACMIRDSDNELVSCTCSESCESSL